MDNLSCIKEKVGIYLWILGVVLLLGYGGWARAQTFSCFDRNSNQIRNQIVGAMSEHTLEDAPWMVNLSSEKYGRQPFCGGTLINNTTVLTAAHCIFDPNMDIIVQRVAEDGSVNGDSRKVSAYLIHPDYSSEGNVSPNDIALLKLESPFDITPLDVPRLLPPDDADIWAQPDDCALVTGWGLTTEGGQPSEYLLGASLPLWSSEDCQEAYGRVVEAENHICAGYHEGGVSSCQGDSGGPLLVRGGPVGIIQVGVVSFGRGCARENAPGVYARVSNFYDWIFESATELAKR
ncbi:MAG: serine protease [Deinococcales bacterium]